MKKANTLKMSHNFHISFEFKTSFGFVGAISKMGNVVVRAPRRLQDINSVILPSEPAPAFGKEDPPSKPGLGAGDSPPLIPYVGPSPPSIWDVNRQCVCTYPRCVYSDDHFQEVQIFLSSSRPIIHFLEGHCCLSAHKLSDIQHQLVDSKLGSTQQ